MKNQTKKKLKIFILILIVVSIGFWVIYSYFNSNIGETKTVKFVITTDYGKNIIQNETIIEVPQYYNIKDALNRIAVVEYTYGGGFVNSINGISSQFPNAYVDWFFFVNGFMSNVGVLDYNLVDGDTVYFDYHNWDYDHLFWSGVFQDVVSSIKQGFAGNTAPTIISYENSSYQESALNLKMYLMENGIQNLTIKEGNFVTENEKGSNNLLLIGGYSMNLMRDYYDKSNTCGFFGYFKNSSAIEIIGNDTFTVEHTYYRSDNVSLVNIGQNPFSPNTIGHPNGKLVVAFSGLDLGSIINSVDKFIANDNAFTNSYGVLFLNNVSFKLPLL
ncbi:MAG: DUF4430 domain-containing protein [Candidatus Helarchaeota archaeon]